jgi:thiaminase
LLKFQRPWIKQDASRKGKVENSSSSKYVPPHSRHIKGKGNIICENANLKSVQIVKKHSNKRSVPHLSSLRHHRSHSTQVSTTPGSQDEGSEEATNKSYIRHSTFSGTSGSTASAVTAKVCSCQSEWQTKEEQIKTLQEKATEAQQEPWL